MEEWQKKLLEHLYDLAEGYYTEKTSNDAYKIPDNQKEKDFIQEVFQTCWYILEEPENE